VTKADTVAVSLAADRPRFVDAARREWALVVTALLWLVFVVSFNRLAVITSDERVQYGFVQQLYGDASHALGYYFGLGLIEAPFYGLGKLLESLGVATMGGNPSRNAMIGLGLGCLSVLVWPLLGPVLRGLRLRYPAAVISAAALGTPFFFYATFEPGKSHALDAVLFSAVVYLAFRYFGSERPSPWLPVAIGAVLGVSYTVRYFSGAEGVVLVLVLACYRRWADALRVAITSAAVCLALMAVPLGLGISVFGGGFDTRVLSFAPLNPLRMLFTNHRGLFVWSPVTVLAAVGLALLFRGRPEHRRFLTAIVAMGVGIMASYSLVGFWDGTWSFSQRFFTPLLPLVAVGLGGLVDAVPRTAIAAAGICAAWSVYLGFNLVVIGGPQYLATVPGGATDLAVRPAHTHTSVGAYLWGVWHKSNFSP
jgi:hypothetical protein